MRPRSEIVLVLKLRMVIIGLAVIGAWRHESKTLAAIETDFLIHTDVAFVVPEPVQTFDPKLPQLWIETLQRPENDLQRLAAESIARGHQNGVPNLLPAVPRLQAILKAVDTHPATRFAAARALIVLKSAESADILLEASRQHGSDLRQLIEPALAGWGHTAAAQIWADRLNAPSTKPRDLVLAIRGLGSVGSSAALSDLVSIATDAGKPAYVRLEAAAAAGQIAEEGLHQQAAALAASESAAPFVNQICSVRLLARHTDPESLQVYVKLAGHAEPSVAAAALRHLNKIDSTMALPLAQSAIQNDDPEVRRQGATSMLRLPAMDHIEPLGSLLADSHPDVRREVCEGLFQLARTEELDAPIRDVAMRILEGDRWQGQEQASLLLGSLERDWHPHGVCASLL